MDTTAAPPLPSLSPPGSGALPRVAAVLVVHNGAAWLGNVLATLARQRYPALDLVVVDNASTDGSAEVLARHIPEHRRLTLPRNVGFGRALNAALQNEAFDHADLVWILHDDLALAPDALERLVEALTADSSVGAVGPKLRDWSEDPTLQEVGMTMDRFGRAESRLEPGELDQGQHDQQRPVLYVSTAGLLVRADLFRALGGIDARYELFRDDLDVCWRMWLAGWRVEVVPEAVGYHVAASSRLMRPGGPARSGETRYLAERNTLASLLKNYSATRLLWVLPVALLLALLKSAGFVASRRFSDGVAVLRACGWNLLHLPRTLRRRRLVQARRALSEAEVSGLLAPGLPRVRTYVEAVGDWLAGGSTRALLEEEDEAAAEEEIPPGRALVRAVRDHPVGAAGLALLVVYLAGLVPLLGAGQLIGGRVAPWPQDAVEFLRAYVAPWSGDPLASRAFGSPLQPVLGFLGLLGFGSAWAAQRIAVLGLLPLAWLFAVRAGRLLTASPLPRLLGGTLYVLSPPVLGALAQGRLGLLIVAALLPGLLLVGTRAADPAVAPGPAWRATALLALGLALAVAGAPHLGWVLAGGWAVLLALALSRRAGWQPGRRVALAGVAAVLLLGPWLVGLLAERVVPRPIEPTAALPLWRALTAVPVVLPGLDGAGGVLAAATVAAVALAAVLVGFPHRPILVAGMVFAGVASGLAAWAASWTGWAAVWPPSLLVPAALVHAGLAVLAAHWLVDSLRAHAFGLRQVAVVATGVVVLVGVGAGIARTATGPWEELARDAAPVPAFVTADAPRVGPYRVLLLSSADGRVNWDVIDGRGPSMLAFGATANRVLTDAIEDAVAGLAGGADLDAAARLGLTNVRYVVVTEDDGSTSLAAALPRQPALDPLPTGAGRIFRVQAWVPRAAVLPAEVAEPLLAGRDPGSTEAWEETGLAAPRRGMYRGTADDGGVLLVSEGADPGWLGLAGRTRLERLDAGHINAFALPAGAQRLGARFAPGVTHRALLVAQILLLLGVISLALRPPGAGPPPPPEEEARLPSAIAAPEPATSLAREPQP